MWLNATAKQSKHPDSGLSVASMLAWFNHNAQGRHS